MRASRRVFGAFLAVVVTVLGARSTAASQTFQHPGVLVSRAQLDYVKIMVAAHTEPFYSAFLKAQNSNIGALNYQPFGPPSDGFIKCGPTSNPNIGCSNADNDSSAAYLQSLLWYITGNQQYANNAITLLNLYGHNLKGYSTGSTYSNAPLQAAWDGEKWPRAAEIIRYSNAGWADSDITAFKNMLNTAILPRIINGSTSNGNWEISMIEALIGIGVFNDDPTTFNTGVTYWKQRIPAYFYYHTDGAPASSGAPRHCRLVRSDGLRRLRRRHLAGDLPRLRPCPIRHLRCARCGRDRVHPGRRSLQRRRKQCQKPVDCRARV